MACGTLTRLTEAAPLRCYRKGCKYADAAKDNGCTIFNGLAISDCREVELTPIFDKPNKKTHTKGSKQ